MEKKAEGGRAVRWWAAVGLFVSVQALAQGPPPGMGMGMGAPSGMGQMPSGPPPKTPLELAEEDVAKAEAEVQAKPRSSEAHTKAAWAYRALAAERQHEPGTGYRTDWALVMASEPELYAKAERSAEKALDCSRSSNEASAAWAVLVCLANDRGDQREVLRLFEEQDKTLPKGAPPRAARRNAYRKLGMPLRALWETVRLKWRTTHSNVIYARPVEVAAIAVLWFTAHAAVVPTLLVRSHGRRRGRGRWRRMARILQTRWARSIIGLAGGAGIICAWLLVVHLGLYANVRWMWDANGAYLWLHHRLLHVGLGLAIAWGRLWLGRPGIAVGAAVALAGAHMEWRRASSSTCCGPPEGDLVGAGLCLLALPLGLLMYRLWTRDNE